MGNLADAYVSVMPDTRGFGPQLDKDLSKVDATAGGKKIGESIGRGAHEGIGSKFKELGKEVVAPVLALFTVDKATEFFKEAIAGASNTAEQQSKVGVVFGKSAEEIYAASEKSARGMGISEGAYLTAAGTLGNLFVALKITPAKAAELSNKMIKLGADMASFNNASPEDTLKAIQSGIVGQYKPLRQYGVAISSAAVKAEALKMGLVHATGAQDKIRVAQIHAQAAQEAYTKAVAAHGVHSEAAVNAGRKLEIAQIGLGKAMKGTVPELTAQQKALASVALIQEFTGKATGDFARTSGGLANQQRILAAEIEDVKDKIGTALLPVVTTVVRVFTSVFLPVLLHAAQSFRDFVHPITASKVAMAYLGSALFTLGVLMKAHAVSMVVADVGMKGFVAQTKIGTVVTKAFAATQWLVNAAMSANPIAIVVKVLAVLVAGLVIAYKTNATFRAQVQAAWAGIKTAVSGAWTGVVLPAFNAMHTWIVKTLIPAVRTFWSGAVVPAMRGIGIAVSTMWRSVVSPAISALNHFVRGVLGPTVSWLWRNVVSPAFKDMGTIIRVWWSIERPILQLAYDIIRKSVGPTIVWLWKNVTSPAFRTMGTIIRDWWLITRPIMQLAYDIIRKTVGPAFSWLWKSVVSPSMSGMGHAISTAWHSVISPVLVALGNMVKSTLAQRFKTGVQAIATAWNGLKNVAKAPVNFMIGTVYDRGIRGLFNKVASVVGSSARMPYIPMLREGGPVPFLPGSDRRKDSVVALVQPGEFVVRQDGSNLQDAMAYHGLPGYSVGGWIKDRLGNIVKGLGSAGSAVGRVVGGVAGAVGRAASSAGGWVLGLLEKAAAGVVSNIRGLIGGIGNSPLAGLLKTGASGLLNHLVDFIKGKDKAAAGAAYNGPIPGGGAVTRWSSTVLSVLAQLHQSPAWLATVLRRMNQESGGNPNAINLWDSNAKAGIPSQGLMQVIPPTFAAYAGAFRGLGIRNPFANIYAGLNYAIHRYHTLAALNRPGGYARGGILNPGQLGFNETRRPERVLSAQQTAAFDRLVAMLDSGQGAFERPLQVNVTNHHPVAEPTSVTVNRALQFTAAIGR